MNVAETKPKTEKTETTKEPFVRPHELDWESLDYKLREDDLQDYEPFSDGDSALLAMGAYWLLRAADYGRVEWKLGNIESTVDGLFTSLNHSRFDEVELAHLKRIMRMAVQAVDDLQDGNERLRKAARREPLDFGSTAHGAGADIHPSSLIPPALTSF